MDLYENVAVAKVTSSTELKEEEKTKLKEKLEKAYGKKVVLDVKVDKSLICGIVVEIDGKIIDGSIRKSLGNVKEVISK